MGLIASMSNRGKATLAGCALAFLAAAILIVKMAGAPSYSTVMTGLDPTKASQVTSALDSQGIGWELQNGGTALAVEKGKASQARIALAGKGLNTPTQPGLELLDKQKLGASTKQQEIAYQRGLEGEIAQTIGQIQGVQGAQVRLTLPQDSVFADEQRPATAAVLLGSDGSAMDPGAVRGIANLVASSVPGLKTSSVTITDSTGSMLWPSGDGSGADGSVPSKPAAEARYDAQLESQLEALLTRTLGPDKAQVQVHSDLNVDRTDEQRLTYAKKGVPSATKTSTETLTGSSAGAGGTAGAAGNIPSYAQTTTAGAGGDSKYSNKMTEQSLLYDKTVAKVVKAPGQVNRLDVALIVDKNAKIAPADLTALKNSIASAAGVQTPRGDTMSVSQVPFAKLPAAKAPSAGLPIPPAVSGALKGVGIGVGALLFLFFVTRHLRRREREELLDEPSWLRQLEAARPAPALAMAGPSIGADQPTVVMPASSSSDPRRQQLEQVISSEPERVAAHLRSWITEDAK
jgi:flagellar M-ring protein FliF